jgi:hypothetical protein
MRMLSAAVHELLWHLAVKPTAPALVRYWTKADNSGF